MTITARHRRLAAPLLITLIVAAVVWWRFSAGVAPSDLLAFLDGATAIRHGVTPYLDPTEPALWGGHAFVYPYLTGWAFAPLTTVPVWTAKVLFFLISVLALVCSWRLLDDGGRAALLVLTLGAEPVVRGLQLGTINALLLLGLAVAWRFRRRAWILVPVLVATVVAKLFLVPMIGWLLFARRFRAAGLVVAGSAAVVAFGCWAAHIEVTTFADMLSVLSAHESPHSSSLLSLLVKLGTPAPVASLLAPGLAACVAVGGGVVARRTGDERHAFAACVVASLIASPIVWSHYYTLLLVVPLLYRWSSVAAATALACSWAIGEPNSAQWLRPVHAFPGAGYVWAVALAAAGLAVDRGRWGRRPHRAAPAQGSRPDR